MNNRLKVLFSSTILGFTGLAVADKIIIEADVYMPVNGIPGADNQGFQFDIANAIFTKAGHTIEYKTLPWERALEETRKNESQCVFGISRSEEPSFIYPKESMGVTSSHFFAKTGTAWQLNGIKSLEAVKLGAIEGYDYNEVVDPYISENKGNKARVDLVGANNALEQNIKKLLAGRIDVLIESPMIIKYKMAEMGIDAKDIADKGTLVPEEPLYIACNKESAKYVDLLNEGFEKIKSDGSLEKMIKKYNVDKWW